MKTLSSFLSRYFTLIGVAFLMSAFVFTFSAFAEDAPKFGDALIGTFNAIKVGAIGGILLAVGQLLKSDFLSNLIDSKINTKALPWIHLAVGILISVGAAWGSKPWYVSVVEGIVAALVSGGTFDLVKIAKPA